MTFSCRPNALSGKCQKLGYFHQAVQAFSLFGTRFVPRSLPCLAKAACAKHTHCSAAFPSQGHLLASCCARLGLTCVCACACSKHAALCGALSLSLSSLSPSLSRSCPFLRYMHQAFLLVPHARLSCRGRPAKGSAVCMATAWNVTDACEELRLSCCCCFCVVFVNRSEKLHVCLAMLCLRLHGCTWDHREKEGRHACLGRFVRGRCRRGEPQRAGTKNGCMSWYCICHV